MKKKSLVLACKRFAILPVFSSLLGFTAAEAATARTFSGNAANYSVGHLADRINHIQPAIPKQVSGKVTDAQGLPLPGVTVTESGTTKGVVTDVAGNFKLEVANENATLTFSMVGYVTKVEKVNGRGTISIVLEPQISNLSEVVVTALGIKKESKKLGYAATNVKVDEITTNRTTNFANALQGKVAGVEISPPTSGPGSSTKIRLRGQSSFTADNSPLIVVNGLPFSQGAGSTNSYTNPIDLGDNLQQINPDDIEMMTVLKGATAAALYGARAANGAIVITTKSGKKNAGIGVEFTSNFTRNQALDFTDFQYEYGQGEYGVRPKTQGEAQSSGGWSFGEKFDNVPTFQFDGVQRPYAPERNVVSKFFRIGNSWTNTLALSGGNDKGSFRFSYSNQDAQGIIPNNDYKKKIFNLGLNHNFTDKLSAQININYAHEKNDNPPVVAVQAGSIPTFIYRSANSVSLDVLKAGAVDANGNETPTSRFFTLTNPYWLLENQFIRQRKDKLLGTALLKYQFFDWLYLQGRANMDYQNEPFERNDATGSLYAAAAPAGQFNGGYRTSNVTFRNMNFDFLLGGGHKWGDFSIDATFGGNSWTSTSQNWTESVTNFNIRGLYTIGNGINREAGAGRSEFKINSLYGTAEFGYKSYLFLNVTGRNDWFSVLSPENNNYFYPSVSGSFIFSEVLKSAPKWLSFGKIRASYAYVGSANGVNPYSNALTFGFFANNFNGFPVGNINQGSTPNRTIRPFSVREKEVGLELRLFNSRVNLDVALYDKQTIDQIIPVGISNASGYTETTLNLGRLQNRGIEISLETVPVRTPNFTWRSAFNTAMNRSKAIEFAGNLQRLQVFGGEFFGSLVHQIGLPLQQILGNTYRRDANGNIIVAGGKPVASTTPVLFGSALPKATGGWVNTFKYKNISLLAQLDYRFGGKVLSSTALNTLRHGLSKPSLVGREGGVIFDAVNADGSKNTTAVNAEEFYANYRSQAILDPFVFKSDFIKLRQLSLSYDFTSMLNSRFVKGLILSGVCNNVAVLKKYTPDIDPEAMPSSGDNTTGYEQAGLPTQRMYGFNLSVKF